MLPSGPREFASDAYTNTGVKVGHGVLPIYRTEDKALREDLVIDGAAARLEDNYLTIEVEGETPLEAYQSAVSRVESFLAHLTIEIRRTFASGAVYFVDADGQPYPPPKWTDLFTVTTYNLPALAGSARVAADSTSVTDARLSRSLHYFEHALFLYENRRNLALAGSSHYRSLIAAVFLNLWKAVSTIIGDPSRDRDYQRRYRRFGIDKAFFDTRIERLRNLRNDYDVAHYELSAATGEQIEGLYQEAVSTAAEVIQRFREFAKESSNEGKWYPD